MLKICSIILIFLMLGSLNSPLWGQEIFSKQNPDELLVWSIAGKYDNSILQEIATNFTRAQVEIVEVPYGIALIKFAMAASQPLDRPPDIIIGAPHTWWPNLKELIAPLDPYIKRKDLEQEFFQVGLEAMSLKDKLYGLPLSIEPSLLIYNQNLVSQPPSTWSELENKVETLNSAGMQGFLFDAQHLVSAWPFLSAYGVTLEDLKKKETVIATPEAINATKFIQNLSKKGVIRATDAESSRMETLFSRGKVGMIIDGPWSFDDYTKADINWGVAPIPRLDDVKRPRPFAFVDGMYLNKYSSKKEIAVEFMKYVVEEENLEKLWLGNFWAPARQNILDVLNEPRITDKYPNFVKIAESIASQASYSQPFPNDPEMDYVWTPFNKALIDILKGESPENALNKAEAEFDEISRSFK